MICRKLEKMIGILVLSIALLLQGSVTGNNNEREKSASKLMNEAAKVVFKGPYRLREELKGHREHKFTKADPFSDRMAYESNLNLRIYEYVRSRGVSRGTLEFISILLDLRIRPFCTPRRIDCRKHYLYRTIDGACNNLKRPHQGAARTRFRRVVPSVYEDGYNAPRHRSVVGNQVLPNARLISTTIHPDLEHPDPSVTNMVPQIGQFLDHDLTLTPEGDMKCCTTDSPHDDCKFNIRIPDDDYFYSKLPEPQKCMDFTRSTAFCFPGRTRQREQFNADTHYIDGSQIYGSDDDRASYLRSFKNGRMRVNTMNSYLLPTVVEVERATGRNISFTGTFIGGDDRVNEMPALATMHTLMVREHNLLADRIQALRPQWDDERIYQITRKIVIAEWQNIVYGEYLPVILGEQALNQYGLKVDRTSKYDDRVDATVMTEFATAAYRFGHTLLSGIIQLFRGHQNVGSFLLSENFDNSEEVEKRNGDGYNVILGGLMVQNAQTFDPFVTTAVTNFLLRERHESFGSDLIARNIQRGRDHGIPGYNRFRQLCGFQKPTSWDIPPREVRNDTWAKLSRLYAHPDDIDFFTGGLAEQPVPNGLSGPTFNCVKGLQFKALKDGDRFFFTHDGVLSYRELSYIRRRKLVNIVCENSNLESVPMDPLRVPSASNGLVSCESLKRSRYSQEKDIEAFLA